MLVHEFPKIASLRDREHTRSSVSTPPACLNARQTGRRQVQAGQAARKHAPANTGRQPGRTARGTHAPCQTLPRAQARQCRLLPPQPPSAGRPARPHPALRLRRLAPGAPPPPQPGRTGTAARTRGQGRRTPPPALTAPPDPAPCEGGAGPARPVPLWSPPRPGAGRSRRRR